MSVGNRLDLLVAQGETLDVTLTLYSDEAESVPRDLTGSTLEAVLEPYNLGENAAVALVAGNGLTIAEPKNGQVRVVKAISAAVFDVGLGHWYLKRTDAAGRVTYPRSGKLVVGRP